MTRKTIKKKRNYFIISAGIIPCLINISRVAIASSISIESIPISPILKSTFDAGLLRSFLPSSEYPTVRRISCLTCLRFVCRQWLPFFYEKILFFEIKNYLISKGSVGLCFISGCISGCILGCISAFLQIKKIPIPAAPISTQSGKKFL